MDADHADARLAAVAAAIADPARARMLCSLLDGCARTATELAALADIGASSASAHFAHLRAQGLVELAVQGKHRYYQLADADVAQALEALLVVAGVPRVPFKPATPGPLCHARTCYDHMAGTVAVRLHDAMLAQRWLQPDGRDYRVTPAGAAALTSLGLDLGAIGRQRRRPA
ncbi:ArsR/SmtB family transcription factor, partial [Bordetella pertussis]|uniref:ArsR/SmtB family transcription factor n=1 Tax=Bordetella pertussis TaxID=520 RepID=UPI0009B29773